MGRYLQAIIFAMLVLQPGYAASFDYHVTSPDMRWAYSVVPDATSCVVRVTLPEVGVVSHGEVVGLEPGGPVAWPKPGEPELPVLPVVFRVDEGLDYHISIEPGVPRMMSIGSLRPVADLHPVSESDAHSRVEVRRNPDPAIYSSTNAWPESWYTVHEARGGASRYVRIGLIPFRYRPVAGELQMYPELVMTLVFSRDEDGIP